MRRSHISKLEKWQLQLEDACVRTRTRTALAALQLRRRGMISATSWDVATVITGMTRRAYYV